MLKPIVPAPGPQFASPENAAAYARARRGCRRVDRMMLAACMLAALAALAMEGFRLARAAHLIDALGALFELACLAVFVAGVGLVASIL